MRQGKSGCRVQGLVVGGGWGGRRQTEGGGALGGGGGSLPTESLSQHMACVLGRLAAVQYVYWGGGVRYTTGSSPSEAT